MASRASVTSHVEASLSSLSSDLLMRVANWLKLKELCVFDTAVNNKALRAKHLFGLISDTFLYPGADVDDQKSSKWQQIYVQWLNMRRVFVKSIVLNDNTTPSAVFMYDTMNRVKPGLVSLTIHGQVDFPRDMAVRNKTLHKLELAGIGSNQLGKIMRSVREWESAGGSLQKLVLRKCDFGNEDVDFGDCDALDNLTIWSCSSTFSTTPGDSEGCMRLLWGILPKAANLDRFVYYSSSSAGDPLNDRGLCLLARFCPHLKHLFIASHGDKFGDTALEGVIMTCTKLETIHLLARPDAGYTDPTIAYTDRTIQTIAASLVSLQRLDIENLQLQNPRMLRGLVKGCPGLEELSIEKSNVSEAELIYLVEHALELQLLEIGKWGHLDLRERWEEIQPLDSTAEDLLQMGIDDPEALLSSHRNRLQVLRAATQQPGDMDSMDLVDRLKAASTNPYLVVKLLD